MSHPIENHTTPIACDLTAIEATYRDQHITTAKKISALAQELSLIHI